MKRIIYIGLSFLTFHVSAQSVSINKDGSSSHPSAILDINSTSEGILLPRITEAQRIAINTPATGLLVFQTDGTAGFYYHNGTAWTSVGGGANGDNLGNHDASQTLNMATNSITGVSNINVSGTALLAGNSYPTTTALNEQVVTSDGSGILSSKYQAGQVVVHATNLASSPFNPQNQYAATSGRTFYDNVIVAPPPAIGSYIVYNSTQGSNASVSHDLYNPGGGATYSGSSGFIAATAGYYQITASTVFRTFGTNAIQVTPFINITSSMGTHKAVYYGSSSNSINFDARHRSRGIVSAVIKLEIGDKVGIFGHNTSPNTPNLTQDGTSTLTIIKL